MSNKAVLPRDLLSVSNKLLSGGACSLFIIAAAVFAQRLLIVLSVLWLGDFGPRFAALLLLAAGALSLLRSRASLHLTRAVRDNILAFYLEPFEHAPAPLLPRGEWVSARLSIALSTLVGFAVDGIAVLLGASLALIPLLFWLSHELGPAVLLPLGLAGCAGAAATILFSTRVEESWSTAFEHARVLLAGISSAFDGAVELAAHDQQKTYKHRLLERASQWSGAEGQARIQSALARWGALTATLGTALFGSALLAPQWLSGEENGGIYRTFLIVLACVPTLQSLSGSIANLWYSRSDLEYLIEIERQFSQFVGHAVVPPEKSSGKTIEIADNSPELQLDQIQFEYAAQTPVFAQAITLSLPSKGFFVISGKNGSGKTTLLYVLLGLVAPTQGRIQLNGVDLSLQMDLWHSRIAFLSQRPFQQKDLSIAENLRAFGARGPDDELLSALSRVQMLDVLKERAGSEQAALALPMASLSAGQARRVLIARLLLRQADTWILDEPDVHLDREGTLLVASLLKEISKQKRVIVAAHGEIFSGLADLHVRLSGAAKEAGP